MIEKKKRDWLYTEKIIVQIGLIVISSIILVRPLGLPIIITQHPQDFYDYVETIVPGTKVIIEFCPPVVYLGDVMPDAVAVLYHLMLRDAKLYFVGIHSPDGVNMLLDSYVWKALPPEDFGYEYGVDYCNLGYIAGLEVAYATLATDIRSAVQRDRDGTPIDNLPMMQGVNSVQDFDLILAVGESEQRVIRHWKQPFNITYLDITNTGLISGTADPYYYAGLIDEYIGGVTMGAEYEKLVGRPGKGVATTDSLTLSQGFIVFLIAIGNIAYLRSRFSGGKK